MDIRKTFRIKPDTWKRLVKVKPKCLIWDEFFLVMIEALPNRKYIGKPRRNSVMAAHSPKQGKVRVRVPVSSAKKSTN